MTNTSIAVMVRRAGVTRATAFLNPARPLEAKLSQLIQTQGKVGNLMRSVGPQCGDRLFNPVLRNGGSPEKHGARPPSRFGSHHCQWAET
jgi:hypothetical protein